MNLKLGGRSGRPIPARAVKRILKRLKSQAFRAIDIVVSATVICFLSPVFAALALFYMARGRDGATMDKLLSRLGLGQLPQLFQVFSGRMSLFD